MAGRPTSCARRVRANIGAVVVTILCSLGVSISRLSALGFPPPPGTDPQTGTTEGRVSPTDDGSQNASVSFAGQGRFLVAVQGPPTEPQFGNDIIASRFDATGVCINDPAILTDPEPGAGIHVLPSLAINADGEVLVGWIGNGDTLPFINLDLLVITRFNFDLFDVGPFTLPDLPVQDHEPSVGIAAGSMPNQALTWSNDIDDPLTDRDGLLYQATGGTEPPIRGCDPSGPGSVCFVVENPPFQPTAWQPAVSQRSDGVFAIVWTEAELPTSPSSPFNITMQLYQSDGTTIGGEVLVNVPNDEVFSSTQQSPAVAIDDAGNLVVTWVGAFLPGCSPEGLFRVFARRFKIDDTTRLVRDPDPNIGEGIAGMFTVDGDPGWKPTSGTDANPTVALTTEAQHPGRFVIAWNAQPLVTIESNAVHAQFFDVGGRPMGVEFRVHLAHEAFPTATKIRRLANSAQHTLDYGSDGRVVTAWTQMDNLGNPESVYFTWLPAGYADTLDELFCCKGDVNEDGMRNGLDIQPFVDLLLNPPTTDPCLSVVDQNLVN